MKNVRTWEELQGMVNEVNGYNGELDLLHYYDNDSEFYEMFFENAESAVRACYYSSNFNFMDDYVSFDGYGNLTSVKAWEYGRLLLDNEDEIVEAYDYLEETGAI